MDLKLGQKVNVSATIKKSKIYGRRTAWERCELRTGKALFLGWRRVKEGHTEYDEGWPIFCASKTIKAALVVFNTRENPVYVLPEDIKPME